MESITSDDILGKTAVDPSGNLLGTVIKLHIDNGKKSLQGITIDQGFMRPDLFVGIEYIRRFGVDAVLVSRVPYNLLKGKRVLSAKGEVLGVVVQVMAEGHELRSLLVSRKTGAFKKEELTVDAKEIKEAGATILLRKRVE